jgi:SAM-dependent methyltransferase
MGMPGMTSQPSTEQLYNTHASAWHRNNAVLLSDYTARPRVLERLGSVRGLRLWDLGCGEGFMGRQLLAQQPKSIEGVDLSEAMVAAARQQAGAGSVEQGGPLHYRVGDLTQPGQMPEGPCDLVIAVFLFNYLSLAATTAVLRHVHQHLEPGGRLVFTVPHPSLAFLRPPEPPFFFDPGKRTYMQSSDQLFEGKIWRRDGTSNPVRSIHKTMADYFQALAAAGWSTLPRLEELTVQEHHLALDPQFFGPLEGLPLHLLFELQR